MATDRDLAVAVARALSPRFGRTLSGWEMTAATGVRGLRLLNEGDSFDRFLFTEAHPEGFAVLRENVTRFAGGRAVMGDSRSVPAEAPFDYVDLDPYGTPVPFVPAALQSVRVGGVLAVTATDLMVLAGAQSSACLRRYGARPVRGRLGPEGGLRILLAYLERSAEPLGRSVRPLLSYSREHYVRTYLEVGPPRTAPLPVESVDPRTWTGPWLGDGGPFGPMWLGPLFDPEFVGRLEVPPTPAHPAEVERFLGRVREESTVDRPFYYEANVLASSLNLAEPPSLRSIEGALRAEGYRVARTHARPEGFRTDAPRSTVEQLLRRLAGAR